MISDTRKEELRNQLENRVHIDHFDVIDQVDFMRISEEERQYLIFDCDWFVTCVEIEEAE